MQLVNKTPFDVFVMASQLDPPKTSATIIVKGTFAIVPDAVVEPVPDDEQEQMKADETFMDDVGRSLAWASDMEPMKPFAEVVVYGNIHAPGGRPAPAVRAAIRIGEWEKNLIAFGDRIWGRASDGTPAPSEPLPFSTMPLRWEFSFGGLDDARNPMGRGVDAEIEIAEGVRGLALPNIEDPDALVALPTDAPAPINFAPVPQSYQARAAKLGTRDKRWATFRAPLPPDDFDPAYHNAAPDDQQFEAMFRGDEVVELEGLNPQHDRLRFQLPNLRLRAFLVREVEGGPTVEETPLDIDTLAIRTEEGQLVAIWRGYGAVAKDGMEDLLGLYVAQEPLGEPPAAAGTYLPEIHAGLFPAAPDVGGADVDAEVANAMGQAQDLLKDADLPADLKQQMLVESDPKRLFDMAIKEIHRQADAIQKAAAAKKI